MQDVDRYEDFTAICDHMPGKPQTLRVSGSVWMRTGGWSCELRRTRGNTGINFRILSLDLVLTPPGGVAPDAITCYPVAWKDEEPEIEYDQVKFRVVGTDDEPPEAIEVLHPQRA